MKFGISNPAWLQAAGNTENAIVPFVITSLEDGNQVSFNNTILGSMSGIKYSTDNKNWEELTNSTVITLNQGDGVYFRNNGGVNTSHSNRKKIIAVSKSFNAAGDVFTLLYPGGTSVCNLDGAFMGLPIVQASELLFGNGTIIATSMFEGCTSLENAPELPAMTLADRCYAAMFKGCTSLVVAPELPATTLTDGCYMEMFRDCSSLENAPELPATTLTSNCYNTMFDGCSSLENAPELPATTLTEYCYNGMFQDCTSLKTSPELPARTLAKSCYSFMFYGCSALSKITCLATDISAQGCVSSWVLNVGSSGIFVKNPAMANWTVGNSGTPTNWTVQDYAA